jgi:hypothetical protein
VPGTTPQRKKHPDGTREHVIACIGLREETVDWTPATPDPRGEDAAGNGLGQGWQRSSPVFSDGDEDPLDEDEIERLAELARHEEEAA